MNNNFLATTAFLIAFLFHLTLFNLCVFVFPIKPESPKPKFFFLGPILKQNDVKFSEAKNTVLSNTPAADKHFDDAAYTHMPILSATHEKNPFAINPITKPLLEKTDDPDEKIVIKSTFDTFPKATQDPKAADQPATPELNIHPYKPLRIRQP